MSTQSRKPSRRRFVAGLVLAPMLALIGTAPSSAAPVCMPRFIAANIEQAVMAYKAARYCQGLPYTVAEASERVDLMRACNNDASKLIDEMLDGNEEHYRFLYVEDPTRVACQAAARIAFN